RCLHPSPTRRSSDLRYPLVVCVDDGSQDGSAAIAEAAGASVVRHPFNLGQGAAIKTGIDNALRDPQMRQVVTFDADGQHQVDDRSEEHTSELQSRFD